MADNYRISGGGMYYAKGASDSNVGSRAFPKATPLYNNANVVVGAGVYETGDMWFTPNGEIRGDGKVIIYGSRIITTGRCYDIEFRGNAGQEMQFTPYNNFSMYNCVLRHINSTGSSLLLYDTVVANSNILVAGNGINERTRCLILNTNDYPSKTISSYVDPISTLNLTGSNPADFRNNNVRGLLLFGGNTYAIQDQLVGTPQDNAYPVGTKWLTEANLTADGYTGTIAGWNTAVATCMNREPLFNNASIGDYSLQSGSPMVGAAQDGISNIGGTEVALSFMVNQNGVGNIEVLTSPEVDTSNPTNWILGNGHTEGYVEFIVKLADQPVTLNSKIDPISDFNFNSDYAGGSPQNRDVVDSFPKTADYPNNLVTTGAAPNNSTLVIAGNTVAIGDFVKVAGESFAVTGNDGINITISGTFRSVVGSGVTVKHGTEVQMASLSPNRLTYELRTSQLSTRPAQDSDWDNSLSTILNKAGTWFTQEWGTVPELIVDGTQVYGGGDTNRPGNIGGSQIQATYINVRVWLRNNFTS